MIKKLSLFLVLFSLVFSLSCNNDGKKANSNTKPAATADVKKGVTPVADNEIAVVETDFGTIKIELYSNIAPKMDTVRSNDLSGTPSRLHASPS